jgi:hypothetical protein
MDFHEILCMEVLLKFVFMFQFQLKLYNDNGHFTLRPICNFAHILSVTC